MKNILNCSVVKWKSDMIDDPIEFLKSLNPMQIVKPQIPLNVFMVNYSYTTSRGNRKTGTKYFLVNNVNPQQNCEVLLNNWASNYNRANTHRQLSNVKFLDSSLLMSLTI